MKPWQERIEERVEYLKGELEKWRDALEKLREAIEEIPEVVEEAKAAAQSSKKAADSAVEIVVEMQGDYRRFKDEVTRRLEALENRKTLLRLLVEWVMRRGRGE